MLELRPSFRLAFAIFAAALLVGLAALVDASRGVLWACLLLLAPVLWDGRTLSRAPAPHVRRPSSVRAALRHPFQVPLELEASRSVTQVALDWPEALGGPVPLTQIVPSQSQRLTQSALPRRRGSHALGPVWLWRSSPLGLWQRRYSVDAPCLVTVWPDLRGPAEDALGREQRDDGTIAALRPGQAGTELGGLRPFHTGDDPRHVDWKASARAGHPIVRQWHPDRQRWVIVVIDAGRLMRAEHDGENKFDAAVRALVRIGMAAQTRGDRVGTLLYADRSLRFIPPLSGPQQADQLVRACADLEPRSTQSEPAVAVPELLALSRRSLVIWLTDVLDADGAERLTRAVLAVATRHLPVVALLRDPSLDQAFARTIDGADAAYRRAAAELVARERDQALERLRARRIAALDLSMRTLALGVVRQYVETRWRGQW
jgi:uncharacterized protein (DUF58 family)